MENQDKKKVALRAKIVANLTMVGNIIIASTLRAPIQFVKIRLQCVDEMVLKKTLNQQYGSIRSLIKTVYAEEGIRAFWKGNFTHILEQHCKFASGYLFNNILQKLNKKKKKNDGTYTWLFTNLLIGFASSVLVSLLSYPLDYARTRLINDVANLQKGIPKQFNGILDVFKKTWVSDGIPGFYRGFIISNFSIIVYRSVYFGLHNVLKSLLPQSLKTNLFAMFSLGFFISTFSGMAAYPIETIRRRMMMRSISQNKYRGSIDCTIQIYKNGGIRPFFNGFLVSFIGNIANSAGLTMLDSLYSRNNKNQGQ